MPKVILIANNIRSSHNVGALFRLCDGLGVNELILVGITPYPKFNGDKRLPHLSKKITNQINKTALGAENSVKWTYQQSLSDAVSELKNKGYEIVALEQDKKSILINEYKPTSNIALIVGNEVSGLTQDELKLVDNIIEIPMHGKKESHNVVTASSIATYHLLNF